MKNLFFKLGFIFIIISVFFTTCDTPMGMGDPIDWQPPELTLDSSLSSPMYVNTNARIFGTVYDNGKINRIILRDSLSGEQLYQATLSDRSDGGWDWEIIIDNLTPGMNGSQISAEIIAYDNFGNSGAESIVFITLIIDIRPPIVEDVWIERSSTRPQEYLSFYPALKELETLDPNGTRSEYVNKYQNGYFTIAAAATEDETFITDITLNIYDQRYPGIALYSQKIPDGQNKNFPKWVINETYLLNQGNSLLPISNYKETYYNDPNARYYYRVTISATDRSNNNRIREEDEGFFCMWANADIPKGILDPIIVGNNPAECTISRGTPLPVEFFDDDTLINAWAGLLTLDQWNGVSPIGSSDSDRLLGTTDEQKLANLRARLTAGTATYNWKRDKYSSNYTSDDRILNQIKNTDSDITEVRAFISTGNSESDYGNYVLFVLVSDKKVSPHPSVNQNDDTIPYTIRNRWATDKIYNIQIIDENKPLIVFDTQESLVRYDPAVSGTWLLTGNSPEENTFPKLINNRYFDISGYTLREDSNEINRIKKFRMAWIPAGMPGGADDYIQAVQNALQSDNYQSLFAQLPDIQYWDFDVTGSGSKWNDLVFDNDRIDISGNKFRKQVFRKRLDVLGGNDNVKDGYQNFRYKGVLENTTKLFIFYAEDNMGHVVFRQLRILGNRTPPDLAIFDITGETTSLPPGLPLPQSYYSGSVFNQVAYDADLKTYNEGTVFNTLRNLALNPSGDLNLGENYRTIPFKTYPRGTILKYWIQAQRSGDLAISSITMHDITNSRPGKVSGSGYRAATTGQNMGAHTFIEYYPDETQRVFLFEAVDTLGNTAQIQRTVAITNAARLESITSTAQNGTYGIGQVITINANFSGQISINQTGTRPQLNVRYEVSTDGGNTSSERYRLIECEPFTGTRLSLEFKLEVEEGFMGQLETLYEDSVKFPGRTGEDARPIKLTGDAKIVDVLRDSEAFVPGYFSNQSSMPNWTTAANSLQYDAAHNPNGKIIKFYGIRPTLSSISVENYSKTLTNNEYYYTENETITVRVTANRTIMTGENNPGLNFKLMRPAGTGVGTNTEVPSGVSYYRFNYSRPAANALDFTFNVNKINVAEDYVGQINRIFLAEIDRIVDEFGNTFAPNVLNETGFSSALGTAKIFIDQKPPEKPSVRLVDGSGTQTSIGITPDTILPFNEGRSLRILEPTISEEAYFDRSEYSLDGGIIWNKWTSDVSLGNGLYRIMTRHVDKAGNMSEYTNQLVHINNAFPDLLTISSLNPNGIYTNGTLEFILTFRENVNATSSATITLQDTVILSHQEGGSNPSHQVTLNAVPSVDSNSVTFRWTGIGTTPNIKDMYNGLMITAMNLSGVTDAFGNPGPASASSVSASSVTVNGKVVSYNLTGIKVSTINPRVTVYSPANAADITGSDYSTTVSSDNRTITLTFSKPVQKGRGTIIIRPHGNYAIPSVFENEGYYLHINTTTGAETPCTNGTCCSGAGAIPRTYVHGFYDIYNGIKATGSLTVAAQRNRLITGGTMASPEVSDTTGLSVGPYLKTTHGLTEGAGLSGYYGNGTATENTFPGDGSQWLVGLNTPGPRINTASSYMVPDLSVKWVLRYNVTNIHDATPNSVVSNIREVLTNAEFRWTRIPVTNNNVTVTGNTVKIELTEPLLPGLQWGVFYPEGTFTDEAGNPARAEGYTGTGDTAVMNATSSYWFWSCGVSKPVIRVDRKSYDARTAGNFTDRAWNGSGGNPYQANGYNGRIYDFNTIHYRIETETPKAIIHQGRREWTSSSAGSLNRSGITPGWTGSALLGTGTNLTTTGTINWNGPKSNTISTGSWIRTNLIYRNNQNATYQVYEAPGTVLTRNLSSITQTAETNRYFGFRSYNRDATVSDLNNTNTPRTATTSEQVHNDSFSYTSTITASKNYVTAHARINHGTTGTTFDSQPGYEGVFRTVVVVNRIGQTSSSATKPMMLCGTNIRSGIPTVPGFPLKDGVGEVDARYLRVMYLGQNNEGAGNGGNIPATAWVWVSTEMVTPWFHQLYGNGGGAGVSYGRQGDANDWVTVGYGDIAYSLNIHCWGE